MSLDSMSKYILSIFCLGATCAASPVGNGTIQWNNCPAALVLPGSRLTCASYQVPLDWDYPEKGNITIGMAKLPAADQANRIGNLFYNPGGPGEQSSKILAIIAANNSSLRVHQEILDRFDLIGVDIRGTGLSEPLKCSPNLMNSVEMSNWYPTDEGSFANFIQTQTAFRESCLNGSGLLLDYLDTISIAKDHEAARVALGDEPLSWFGQSYGTFLGSQYAELFPKNIRAMMIDGVASFSQSQTSTFVEGALGAEITLKYFFDWCGKQNETVCPFGSGYQNQTLEDLWTTMLDQAEKTPIPAAICEAQTYAYPNVSAGTIRFRTVESLYTPAAQFAELGQALYNLSHGDASGFYHLSINSLLQYMLTFVAPQPAASTEATVYNNSYAYDNIAAACAIIAHTDNTITDVQLKTALAESITPLLKGMSPIYDFQHLCTGWPAPVRNPPHKIEIPYSDKLPHILLVTSVYDPATAWSMGLNLRDEIGQGRAVLITRNGPGHTTYFQPDSYDGPTVAAMNKYLLELEIPEDGVFYET